MKITYRKTTPDPPARRITPGELVTVILVLCLLNSVYLPLESLAAQGSYDEQNKAAEKLSHKKYKSAYKHFRHLAERGCPYSQCVIGMMHHKGIGTTKNSKEAIFWLEKSAAQGWKDAQHRLGMIHLTGNGVEKNVEKGVFWLRKAAAQGVQESKQTLAELGRESNRALNQGSNYLKGEASLAMNQAESMASSVPSLPGSEEQSDNAYSKGLQGVQKSWVGYFDVAKNLDALSAKSGK